MKTTSTILIGLFICINAVSQIAFEPFAEIRLVTELHLKPIKKGNLSNVRLVGNVGVKSYFVRIATDEFKINRGKTDIFLAPNIAANLLLGRGIGASVRQNFFQVRHQLAISGIVGVEWGKPQYNRTLDFQTNSLSGGLPSIRAKIVGISSNWVMVTPQRNKLNQLKYQQRVGGLFAAWNAVSIAYTNDGPPFDMFGFGDGGDRMFTGYGQIAYTQKSKLNPLIYKITYERYTGWEDDAYEIATDIKHDFVEYNNNYTPAFTRGQYRLGVQNTHFRGGVTLNDFDNLDFQNIIHLLGGNAFHRTPVKASVSIWGGISKSKIP